MKSILISTSSFNVNGSEPLNKLVSQGFLIKTNPYGRRLTENELISLITPDTVGMIAGVEQITANVLMGSPSLKVIARCGSGLDNVDLISAAKTGVLVSNTPAAPVEAVAELTMAHMLNILRMVVLSDRNLRNRTWKPIMGSLLAGKNVGVIGYGRIGKRVSQLVLAFGATVFAYDEKNCNSCGEVRFVKLDELVKTCDIVTVHLPYEKATRHIINDSVIAKMKRGVIILNLSRGGLVDERALLKHLRTGHVFGAGIDTFEEEPYLGELLNHDNVILTAHMGSYAKETRELQELEAASNLIRDLKRVDIIK